MAKNKMSITRFGRPIRFRRCKLLLLIALGAALQRAQYSAVAQSRPAEGTAIFALRCAGCHGADARGTDHGPPLAGVRRLRGRSVSSLRQVIHDGIPSSGMPAFDLPAAQLDALAGLVRGMNSPASESALAGDRGAGEKYFLGRGKCIACHMVYGRGSAVGPDLSNVGREFTVDELRQSLLQPSARITPGYQMVTVKLRDGRTLRGFARSRSNFDLVLEDLQGQFHPLGENQISSVEEENQSVMPPVKAASEELKNLLAYLGGLTGVKPGIGDKLQPAAPGGITFLRILDPHAGDWLTYNGDLSANRYNKLAQINTANVSRLNLKWIFSVPLWKQFLPDTPYFHQNMEYFGLEVTPLVADGIMYATGPEQAFALDARTGREIWEYSRPRPSTIAGGDAALGTNRGVALLGDKVFLVTPDAHLIALNRTTGQLVWEVVMPDEPMQYGSTLAPLVVKDAVVAGVSGGDWGMRGFVAAYRASNGECLWRHWTIPGRGDSGADSWGQNPRADGGGATWLTGSYDPETDTLFWPTGNAYPDSDDRTRPGDNLYTCSILALNPDSGKLKWFYQVTPHDTHDWDANAPLLLVDTKYRGEERKLLLHADKNGFLYVLDRTDGHVLLASKFVRANWASGIGVDGRPQLLPESGVLCPENGTNWNATAFSPEARLYYVMALEKCEVKLSASHTKVPQEDAGKKYLRALDIETGKVVWEIPQIGPVEGKREAGVLATAGGILIYGDPAGDVVAVDQRNGKKLWHFPTNGENKASPMTYMVDGKQYIALAVGPNILCFSLP